MTVSRRQVLAAAGVGAVLATTRSLRASTTDSALFARRIPDAAFNALNALAGHGITAFAFTPTNEWVVVTEDGNWSKSANFPADCATSIGNMLSAQYRILCIAFTPSGGWTVTANGGFVASGIPDECYQTMLAVWNGGQQIIDVAFPPQGGNSWTVIGNGGSFYARNINDVCYQMMRNYAQGGQGLSKVKFDSGVGWVVLSANNLSASNIDAECYQQLGSFSNVGSWIDALAFSQINTGWAIYSHNRRAAPASNQIRSVERALPAGGGAVADVWTRMAFHNVPGASVAFVDGNALSWTTAYGLAKAGSARAAHPETVFQAASISKVVAAVGISRFCADHNKAISTDVRSLLTSWTLSALSCLTLKGAPTIDRVLRHQGGIIGSGTTTPTTSNACGPFDTSGGGFGGYTSTQAIPTLLQILNGTSPANSKAIKISTDPGTQNSYSGHGFVVLMQMIKDQTGIDFSTYLQSAVLQPLGMSNSVYATTAPNVDLASGHLTSGAVIAGDYNRYPEHAAAGLWTTCVDLAKLVAYINQANEGTAANTAVLSMTRAQTMLTPTTENASWGQGVQVAGIGTNSLRYTWNGINLGYRCELWGYPKLNKGFVVMTNGDDIGLKNEVVAAIKATYALA